MILLFVKSFAADVVNKIKRVTTAVTLNDIFAFPLSQMANFIMDKEQILSWQLTSEWQGIPVRLSTSVSQNAEYH